MTVDQRGGARRRPGRPPRSEAGDTKALLQNAALRLFARHGFAGTSIRAIAQEVGLSESVIYAHFANKQAVFEAVLAEFGPRTHDRGELGPGPAADDPAPYLLALARTALEEWDREEARLLMSLMARDGLLHSAALQEALSAMRHSVEALFERWIEAGRVRRDLGTPQSLALSFTGPIGLTRIMCLHAEATEDQRAAARADILDHVATFNRAVFGGATARS
ncbi:MAG TPA: helix-turn-helix domain-containing protein [Glycomyces sp.]|nr:helix-turn-helix domain-containing protein [Glycomyces sp.]